MLVATQIAEVCGYRGLDLVSVAGSGALVKDLASKAAEAVVIAPETQCSADFEQLVVASRVGTTEESDPLVVLVAACLPMAKAPY